jgi:hypothetical protein
MKIKDVVSAVTKREGKRVAVSVGNVREVLRCLRDLCREDREAWSCTSEYLRYSRMDSLKPRAKRVVRGKK